LIDYISVDIINHMHTTITVEDTERIDSPLYAGLRMSADEYLQLPNDEFKYELVDGVVVLSPSPEPKHQQVLGEIHFQLKAFLRTHPIGSCYIETDIRLDARLVYRPELVFLRKERVRENWKRIQVAPDLVLEVISPESRRYDSETKKGDYERFGVKEYWLIDPYQQTMVFYRLESGRFVEIAPQGDKLAGQAVPGFTLDLAAVRTSFEPL